MSCSIIIREFDYTPRKIVCTEATEPNNDDDDDDAGFVCVRVCVCSSLSKTIIIGLISFKLTFAYLVFCSIRGDSCSFSILRSFTSSFSFFAMTTWHLCV